MAVGGREKWIRGRMLLQEANAALRRRVDDSNGVAR